MSTVERVRQPEDILACVLNYATQGMSVLPVDAKKDPLVRWRKGDVSQRATTNPVIIEGWWAEWPYADCAWALPADVLVVDIDRKSGRDGYSDFKRLFGCDPREIETPMTTSPSGGLHLFYRAAKSYKNVALIDGTGLDTRAEGGFAILPSPNNGREWLRPFTGAPLLPAPDWFDRVQRDTSGPPQPQQPLSCDPYALERGRTALERACARIVAAPNGTQEMTLNRECFSIGGWVGRGDVDYAEAHAALFAAALEMPAYAKPWTGLSERVDHSLEDGVARPMPTRDDEARRAFRVIDNNNAFQREAKVDGAQPPPVTTIRLTWHGEESDDPLIAWLVEDMLYRVGLALMAGQWGTYKTFVAIDLAAAVMTKAAFAGRAVHRQGGVLFIAAEGQAQLRIRLEGVALGKVAAIEPPDDAVKIDPQKMPIAWAKSSPRLSDPAALGELRALVTATDRGMQERFGLPLALILIDALMPAAQFKDADKSTEGRQVMDMLAAIAREFDLLVIAIDHFGKDVSTGTRNSSAKEDAADSILALLGERSLEGRLANPRMALRKVKGAEQGIELLFDPREVVVGETAGGLPIKTFVIDWQVGDRTPKPPKGWPKSLMIFKRAFDKTIDERGKRLRPFSDGSGGAGGR
jgi:hypothetical protein